MSVRTQRFCEHCNSRHDLKYLVAAGEKHKHLIYECPKKGVKFVDMVEGLPIPTTYSKQWYKDRNKTKQQELL